jgi:hypothetical protein
VPRRIAREIEAAAARGAPPAPAPGAPGHEALAMLVRRGLDPRPLPLDVPFSPDLGGAAAGRLAERLGHYAFRLFLRGAILRPRGFLPGEATRYLRADQARGMAEELVELGIACRAAGGRYRLCRPARSFGGTLEWYLARELRRTLGLDVAAGVRSGAPGVGGDLDLVAAAEGRLVYLELKSSPPKHVDPAELAAFLRRIDAVRPHLSVLVVDTALRLGDKVVPELARELALRGREVEPRRARREIWAFGPHLYAVNARQDLVENVRVAVSLGLRALAPDVVPPLPPAAGPGPRARTRRRRTG